MNNEKTGLALQRTMSLFGKMQQKYKGLQKQLASLRDAMAALPYVGHYPPNATLCVCARCGDGPFNAHEIRLHRPKCLEKK